MAPFFVKKKLPQHKNNNRKREKKKERKNLIHAQEKNDLFIIHPFSPDLQHPQKKGLEMEAKQKPKHTAAHTF